MADPNHGRDIEDIEADILRDPKDLRGQCFGFLGQNTGERYDGLVVSTLPGFEDATRVYEGQVLMRPTFHRTGWGSVLRMDGARWSQWVNLSDLLPPCLERERRVAEARGLTGRTER